MKLLLTSNGISNPSIAQALLELMDTTPEVSTVVFIPTASTIETGDKKWVIDDLWNIKSLWFRSIEITDISAVDESIWRPSLEHADIIVFWWGNTYHLMNWMGRTWLSNTLRTLLEWKIYMGISAGSMITSPDLNLKLSEHIYDADRIETTPLAGLGLVDFYFLPHLNSDGFPKMRRENIEMSAKSIGKPLYALDDDSALQIIDGEIRVVSEGEYCILNPTP